MRARLTTADDPMNPCVAHDGLAIAITIAFASTASVWFGVLRAMVECSHEARQFNWPKQWFAAQEPDFCWDGKQNRDALVSRLLILDRGADPDVLRVNPVLPP